MDSGVLVGIIGSLIGVGLGALLGRRSSLELQKQARKHALIDAKRIAYVEYLSTMRKFRRYIIRLDPVDIEVVEGAGSSRGPIPLIKGADVYWDEVERVRSQLWIVTGYDSSVREAADRVMDAIYVIAREQAKYPAGALPASTNDISRQAEREFARSAHCDLVEGN